MEWFFFLIGATAFAIAYFTTDIPDPNEYVNSQATVIQYANGDEVGRIGAQNRTIIPLARIPQDLRRAVLAAEDKGFYSQGAFNPIAILRGAINTALGRGLQGGSTITQQYAKTAFLTPDRTIQRKIIELIIAIKLENQLSKDEIFENYLNTIYFGRGAMPKDIRRKFQASAHDFRPDNLPAIRDTSLKRSVKNSIRSDLLMNS